MCNQYTNCYRSVSKSHISKFKFLTDFKLLKKVRNMSVKVLENFKRLKFRKLLILEGGIN